MRRRTAESDANLGGAVVLALIAGSIVAGLPAILSDRTCSDAAAATRAVSSPTSTASAPAGASAPRRIATDPLSLTALSSFTIEMNSSAVADLADPVYRRQVATEWSSDVAGILPQTVMGYVSSSRDWKQWALQNMPDGGPAWVVTGFIPSERGQFYQLVPPPNATTENPTTATLAGNIQQYAASAAGYSLAALDFVSFNGVSALRVYFETDDAFAAGCQTLPAQLVQLYKSAFDSHVPKDLRAKYLGKALAATTVIAATAGAKGFSAKFGDTLNTLGLKDAWPAIKPQLGKIGTYVSTSAASLTLTILQNLVRAYPADSAWVTGLTADRIGAMVDVLHDARVPAEKIQADIQNLAKASENPGGEDSIADAADTTAYQASHELAMHVKSQNRLVRYQDHTGRTSPIKVDFLEQQVPGFDRSKAVILEVHYKRG